MRTLPLFLGMMAFLLFCGAADAFSRYPDFDNDAKPILRHQSHLLHYVLSHYDVKPIGYSKYPGNDQHPPLPPFIFQARPVDSDGPYTIGLYISDGDPGHILRVFHINAQKTSEPNTPQPTPSPQNSPPPEEAPTGSPQNLPQDSLPTPSPVPTQTNAAPTSDIPTGPLNN